MTMQATRSQTIKYITDMVGELQKMAEKNDSPVLALLLKMAKMEGKNILKDGPREKDDLHQDEKEKLTVK